MRLVSVNVGLPRDIEWNGHLVHTGIWKRPVGGRCRVGRLNLEGDGQGDLAGHGWTRIGGILGFATAIAAFYGSFAGVINSTFGRVIAPLFPLTGTIPGARR